MDHLFRATDSIEPLRIEANTTPLRVRRWGLGAISRGNTHPYGAVLALPRHGLVAMRRGAPRDGTGDHSVPGSVPPSFPVRRVGRWVGRGTGSRAPARGWGRRGGGARGGPRRRGANARRSVARTSVISISSRGRCAACAMSLAVPAGRVWFPTGRVSGRRGGLTGGDPIRRGVGARRSHACSVLPWPRRRFPRTTHSARVPHPATAEPDADAPSGRETLRRQRSRGQWRPTGEGVRWGGRCGGRAERTGAAPEFVRPALHGVGGAQGLPLVARWPRCSTCSGVLPRRTVVGGAGRWHVALGRPGDGEDDVLRRVASARLLLPRDEGPALDVREAVASARGREARALCPLRVWAR